MCEVALFSAPSYGKVRIRTAGTLSRLYAAANAVQRESNVFKAWAREVYPSAGEQAFLTAAVVAVAAAIFTVAFWAPLQMRAFSRAVEEASGPAYNTPSASQGWTHVPFTTADGETTSLSASGGRVRVVTMMYTHCPGLCPLAISTLQRMDGRLTDSQRSHVSFVTLSLDPEHDSVVRLREYRQQSGMDPQRWIVGKPSIAGKQQLASAMGVSFRTASDGTIEHRGAFLLLDKSGRVLARSEQTGSVESGFFSALQAAADAR
jgi:protein SCO1